MTIARRLRFLLIFTLISSLTLVSLLQAEQPANQTADRRSPTVVLAPVSVLVEPAIIDTARTNATASVLPDPESNPNLAGTGSAVQRPANNGRMSRQVIRSMDIHDRPYRLGHFYGNTVRRRN